MKKFYLLLFIVITNVLAIHAQLSDLHYLPPLKQGNGGTGSINQQRIYLSTPETTPFDVTIYRGTSTTILATISNLSNTNSQTYNLANGNNGITLVTTANTGQILTNAGLRLEAAGGEKFYVNYRGRSSAQGTSLTSKGRPALGTSFKWGGRPNYGTGQNTLNAVLGIMATEDDTTISIFGYDSDCTFRDGSDADGITADNLTINLDAGESYVLEAPRNNGASQIDCWLGASIQSNKKIAISNGNLNGAPSPTTNSRDAGIDQPVPENVLGREYVFVRANGTDINETPIIIGTQNGTEIFVNGSATPIATINNGDYFVIPGSNYSSGTAGGNMYVTTSNEVYAYQNIAGSTAIQTGGLNFIAPVNCLMPPVFDNIHNIRDVAGLNYTGGITIIASTTTPDGNITVEDGSGPITLPASVAVTGTSDWKTFTVTGLSGDVKVTSTGPISVGFFGVNSNAGLAGYFSGFDTVPIVELDITGGGCLPGSDVFEVTGGFDAYQWFENGVEITGETTNSYTPSGPGDFYVRVTRGACTYDSAILSAYNCDPEIVITKTADTNTVIEGDTVTFTITVEHLGVNPVTNLVINDVLPPEFSFGTVTPSYGSWTAPNWTIGDMFSGEFHTLTVEATVNEVAAGAIVTNVISNTQTEVEANALPDDPDEDITIINNELTITKTDRAAVDGSYDTVGEVITYDFVVTNTGDQVISSVTITDPNIDSGSLSPASVSNLGIGASANFTATHTITQADLEADQVVNSATAEGTLSNGFVISDISDDPDDATTSTDDPTITMMDQKGSLVLEKIAQPAPDGLYDNMVGGSPAVEQITYEFTVINTGNVSLDNITITDPNIDVGSLSPASVANLPAGESAVFTATHTIVSLDFTNGNVTNSATVTGEEPVEGTVVSDTSDDPTTIAPDDSTIVSIPQFGQLEVTKVDDEPTNGPYTTIGQVISYTLVVTNVGNVPITDVNIVDPNADTVTLVSTTGTDDGLDDIVDSLAPASVSPPAVAETATFLATHTITQEDLDANQVVNTATAGGQDPGLGSITDLSDDPDDPTTTIDDPTIVPLGSSPGLVVTKTADDASNVSENQVITYTYVVTNTGNVTFDDVSINDIHGGTGTLSTPEILSTTGTDADNSDNEIDELAPGETATWTATYTINATDISNQSVISNTVTAIGTPRTRSITNPTATENVTVNPIEDVCSGVTLSHDLTADVDASIVTFSWSAADNPLITGETTAASSSSIITDTLENTTNADQEVVYTIIGYDSGGVIQDQYTYTVTVLQTPLVVTNLTRTICSGETLSKGLAVDVDNFSNGLTFSWSAADNPDTTGETTSVSTDNSITDTLVNTSITPQDVVYTITPTGNGCDGSPYTLTVTVHPLPTGSNATTRICSDETVGQDLNNDVDLTGVTFSWVAADNPNVTGESLSATESSTITDSLNNSSGVLQDVVYTVTPTSDESCEGATFTVTVTVEPELVLPANGSETVECIGDAVQPAAPTVTDIDGDSITPVITENTDPVCEGDKIYFFNYIDCAGNDNIYTYTYTIDSTTSPVVPSDAGSTVECLADAVQPTAPAVTDVCGVAITPVVTENTDPVCEGSKIYTFTYTDCAGNASVYNYTYTIDISTSPVVPSDAGSTVECLADAVQPTAPVVNDVCGVAITPVITENTDPVCEGDKIYTFTYTDCAGNASVYTYTYTIDITTNPVVPANAGSTIECLADAVQPTAPVVTDVCGNVITPIITENADPVCEGEKIYAFLYRDCSNNTSTYVYTYTIDITTPPAVPSDAGTTVECLADVVQPAAPVVTDVCGVAITPVITENTDPVCEGDKIYTFTYTDCAGNVSVYNYTYTIDITTSPVVPSDAGSTVECLADAVQPAAPVVTDVCGVAITPVITENTDPVCEGDKIYTFTYTDCSGNASVYTYTYTIDITTSPVVPSDAGSTVECLANAVQPVAPLVTDVCGVAITPVITENTDPVCEGSKIYTFTYTDCAGNASVYTYTYTIDISTSPTVPLDAGSTVECLADAVQPTSPVVTDVCGVAITPVITENTDPLCEGAKIYTFTYTDCAGNASVYTYTYTIDTTTMPVVPSDAGSTVECLADAVQPAAPVVTDACGDAITPVVTENTDPVCEGDKIYTFTYTDCAGNASIYTYTYTIDITTSPVVPSDTGSTVECLADAVQPTAPAVTDVCGVAITPVVTENTDPVCEGSKVYTFTYTDCSGNASIYTYTYTIDITTSPVVPSDGGSTVECLADAVQPTAPAVTDVCGVAITPVVTENTDPVCEGSKVYTFTYTDCSGNASIYTYTYTIDITSSPTVPSDGGSTVECLADAVQPAAPVVTDVCGVAITPVVTENTDPVCEGDKIYTFTYTDCSGNASVYNYTYTIDITTSPVVPSDAGSTVECLADAVQPTAPVVTDVCGVAITAVVTENTDPVCEGDKIYTFTYTDCSGNASVYNYTYTIDITTSPVVPSDAGSTVECLADAVQPTAPVVTDVCGVAITAVVTENMDPVCEGDKVYTFTYTDCAGNASVYTYTYTIDTTTMPVVPSDAGSTVECLADAVQPAAPVVTDACGDAITPVITENTDPVCEGDKIYTFTYTDCAGNASIYTYTYTIDISTSPVVPSDAGSTVECLADAVQPTAPAVTDVCGVAITPVVTENTDPVCEGDKIYTFTYTDCAGNASIYTYTYTIDISTSPVVPSDAGSTVECLADAVQPTAPAVTDVCGVAITPVITENTDPVCEGDKIYTFTYTDCAGNASIYTYTYTIDITTSPVVPSDAGSTVECLADAVQPTAPVVTDVCGVAITPVVTENTDPVCEGDKIYTFTYTDCAGNASVYNYTYTIDITTSPVVPSDAGSTVECLADAVQPTAPLVTDVCGVAITPVITENTDPVCEGDKIYTFTYTDCAGNASVYNYTYTIDITISPVVPSDGGSTVECLADAVQPTAPVVTDVCGVAITPVVTENTDPLCEGGKIYTFTYTDCAGNASIYTYTYTIDITTSPVVPSDAGSTVECLADAVQPVAPVVTDACGDAITPVITENTDPVCEGDKIYTFTYTDCAGNASVYAYTYTIDITTSPVVPSDGGSTVECLADAVQPTAPVVTDVCGVAITPVVTENTDPVCEGDKVYTFTYTDCSGNASVYTYTYTIDITTSPVVPSDAGSTVECLADAVQPAAPVVTDVCGVAITPVITENTDPVCEGGKIYTFTYTDCSGNASVYTYTYTIDITTSPVVPSDAGSTVECLADAVQPAAPLVTDACGVAITPVITENTDPVCEGDKIYTFTYTDCSGNASVYTYTYTIDITTSPTVPSDGGSTVECLADAVQPAAPVVTDVCGVAITPVITENTDPVCEGDKIYTFTYTDCSGNASVYTYRYTIDITTSPVVPSDGVSTVNSLADAVQPAAPVVTDVCGVGITPVITENADPVCDGDKIYTFTYTDCAGNASVYTYIYTIDITSTLEIADTTATVCSGVALGYDLTTLIGLTGVTFEWTANNNPNLSGASDGSGTTISDVITNITINDEALTYTITPFNSDGCEGNEFDLTVTVQPEPAPNATFTETVCSDIPLNYDLNTTVDLSGTTFSWQAADNSNVSGETTTATTSSSITDVLVNTSNMTQVVVYTITPTSPNTCQGNSYEYTVTVLPRAELEVTKIALPPLEGNYNTLGQVISYEIVVENLSEVVISDVELTDSNADAGSIQPDIEGLSIPALGTITFTAEHTITQDDLDAGSVLNMATIEGQDPCGTVVIFDSDDPNTAIPDDSTEVILEQNPSLELIKVANMSPDGLWDEVGEALTYTLTLINTGNVTLTDITVSDTNADVGSISPAMIASISPGQEIEIAASHTITSTDLDSGFVRNSAQVEALDPNSNTIEDISDDPNDLTDIDENGDGNPDDATITSIPQFAFIDIEKTVDQPTYSEVGEVLEYTFTITNMGNVTLFDVMLDDPRVNFSAGNTLDELSEGESVTFSATYTVTQNDINEQVIINSALVTALLPDQMTAIIEDSDDPNDMTNADPDNDGDFDDPTISYLDSDGDGVSNINDLDDDNDGITDIEEQNGDPFLDTDGDGIIDSLDLDADNDGLFDVEEAGHLGIDADGDHRVDGPVGSDGIPDSVQDDPESGEVNYDPRDTDADGIDDFQEANNSNTDAEDGIEVFNIVTPNGDGDHDILLIAGIEEFPDNELSIFNRWGVRVYYAKGYGQNEEYFRGESNGRVTISKEEQLPVGTYFYILSYKTENEATINKSGYLYLTR